VLETREIQKAIIEKQDQTFRSLEATLSTARSFDKQGTFNNKGMLNNGPRSKEKSHSCPVVENMA
jgi:hypothetical protein